MNKYIRMNKYIVLALLVMTPQPNHFHDALVFQYLVNQSMLDIDSP